MKAIRTTGLGFKNFIRGLELLGYEPKWHYSDGGDQYCDVVTSMGDAIDESLGQLLDTQELTLDGYIDLGERGCLSLQNTYRRWSVGTLPAFKKSHDLVVQPLDRLVAGLLILKAYAPDVAPDSCTLKGRSLMVQDERFESISEQDRSRLDELGWWTNGQLAWGF